MKWEYRIDLLGLVSFDDPNHPGYDPFSEARNALNVKGGDSWEAVSIIPGVGKGGTWHAVLLKRPLEAA